MGKIIELYGLPGCGKTTIILALSLKLKECNYKLCDEQIIYDKTRRERFLHLLSGLLKIENYRFNKELLSLLICSQGFKNLFYYIGRYLKLVKLNSRLNENKDSYDYIVLSEGYLQVFLSLFDQMPLTKQSLDFFKKNVPSDNWYPIYIRISEKVADKRIKNRHEDNDIWLKMTEEQRSKNLKHRGINNALIASEIKCIEIDGEEDIVNNVDMLIDIVK